MNAGRRISFSESALEDLEQIRSWHASHSTEEAAAGVVADIFDRLGQLAEFPESGRVVPEFEMPWLRELIQPPFRIVYRLDREQIRVVRIWRSERLMEELPEDS